MKQIVAVRMKGGNRHEHIAGVAYIDPSTRPISTGTLTLSGVLKLLDAGEEIVVVDSESNTVEVIRVKNVRGQRYVRTREDGVLTDNLLALPRYELE
ncbi:MAG TPA: DUF3892 domain-containing protein [Candidatus Cybelea sp.]|nr:DUF3892 domain-containing protein [Candidatus Cybelea sp.]